MKNKIFTDKRGSHMKFFENLIAEELGFNKVKEIFSTINNKGTVRAFHYQGNPKPQQKIIKPLSGKFNIRVIDMENKRVIEYDNIDNQADPIFIQKGNMLGYVSLENESTMLYIADEEFDANLNFGVNPMSFNVDWKFDGELIMSERDKDAEVIQF